MINIFITHNIKQVNGLVWTFFLNWSPAGWFQGYRGKKKMIISQLEINRQLRGQSLPTSTMYLYVTSDLSTCCFNYMQFFKCILNCFYSRLKTSKVWKSYVSSQWCILPYITAGIHVNCAHTGTRSIWWLLLPKWYIYTQEKINDVNNIVIFKIQNINPSVFV